jgi:hypothetical protein
VKIKEKNSIRKKGLENLERGGVGIVMKSIGKRC